MGCIGSRVDIETNGRKYNIKRLIASGGFSQIFCAMDLETNEKVAIKKITCHSELERIRINQEIHIHKKFGENMDDCQKLIENKTRKKYCMHILPILSVYEERISTNVSVFLLIFPLCRLGTVQDELTKRRPTKNYIGQKRILLLFRQLCLAVEVLHNANPPILHRDLKPANLLLKNDDHLYLTDFGSSTESPILIDNMKQRRLMLDEAAELCTMPYRAPELFTCELGTIIDKSLDIWSLGCVLYAMCYFCSPYDEVHERGDSVALAVQSARLNFDLNAPFNHSITDLISSLIKFNPAERPKISDIIKSLNI